jgi:hypothetical protein
VGGWRDRLPVPRLDETTFVHRIFGGYFRSQVQCINCGFLSNTYDPFLDLALEVSRQSSTSIATALAEFTKKETLDCQNRWKCSGCHKYVCATKQLTVFRPPLALCIQLKRFSFGSYGGNNAFTGGLWKRGGRLPGNKLFNNTVIGRGGSKITKPIEFPADLNIPLSDGRSCAYSLTGVIIHVGGSASSGHYTAYVKRPGAEGVFEWFHLDDSFVEQVSEKQVLRQKDAYVLFYCRKEVKLEFPAPPKLSMSTAEAKQLARVRAKTALGRLDDGHLESTRKQQDLVNVGMSPSSLRSAMNSTTPNFVIMTANSLAGQTNGNRLGLAAHSSTHSQSTSRSPKKLDPPGRVMHSLEAADGSDSESLVGTCATRRTSNGCPQSQGQNTAGNQNSSMVTSKSDESTLLYNSAEPQEPVEQSLRKSTMATLDYTEAQTASLDTEPFIPWDDSDNSSQDDDKCSLVVKNGSITVVHPRESMQSTTPLAPSTSTVAEAIKGKEKEINSTLSALSSSSTSGSSVSDSGKSNSTASQPFETFATKSDTEASSRKSVVLDRGGTHGKLEVILGPRTTKDIGWKPTVRNSSKEHELLGNRAVGRWDDHLSESDGDGAKQLAPSLGAQCSNHRVQVIKHMEDSERSRKRKMHLDRWDSHLDQGKVRCYVLL